MEQSGNRDEDEIINNSNTGIKIKLDSSTEYLNFENNFFLSTTTDTNMASNLNVSWISAENTSKDSDDKDFNLIIATAISDVSIPS